MPAKPPYDHLRPLASIEKYRGNDEWKNFWQRTALGLLSIFGAISMFILSRFIGQFDNLSQSVGSLQNSVTELNVTMKNSLQLQQVLQHDQERIRKEIDAIRIQNLSR